jgi:isoleucyl-tRNA synthetase
MSVVLTGRAPYKQVLGYEKMLDETGREMHSSWGNTIDAPDAFARMGADVMRWQFCAQPPDRNLLFGFGPGREIQRRLLTLWNSIGGFFVPYANIEGFEPRYAELGTGPVGELAPLDRWLVARTARLVEEATAAYEAFLTVDVIRAFDEFVEDLSNWYIRRSRRRFWDGDRAALSTLWFAIVQSLRVVAPVLPFLTEHLWQKLARGADGAPVSVHLGGWPEPVGADAALLEEVAAVRGVVRLGHQARATSQLKLRQPLRRLVVDGSPLAEAHADEIRDELRVQTIEFGPVEATELRVKPHLPALGPKLGKELGTVRTALAAGEFEELPGGGFRVAGHELTADEVLVERSGKEGWAVASEDGVTVALETTLDAELELQGRVYDLIHLLNSLRKEQGLDLTDRIAVTLPDADADLLAHAEWIKAEVLAVSLEADGVEAPQIAKV